jgi:hypothetical protein
VQFDPVTRDVDYDDGCACVLLFSQNNITHCSLCVSSVTECCVLYSLKWLGARVSGEHG